MQYTIELNSDEKIRIGIGTENLLIIHFDLIKFLIYCEDFSRTKLLKTDYKLCDMFLFRLLQST